MRKRIDRVYKAAQYRRGQGIVEYALLLVLAIIIMISALTTIGWYPSGPMENVSTAMEQSAP